MVDVRWWCFREEMGCLDADGSRQRIEPGSSGWNFVCLARG